jgi:hypothetical protein
LAVTQRVELLIGEGTASANPLASFMDFARVRATVTARGNGAIIQERGLGELFALLDYRKDVISNQQNEQHLFTKSPKH